MRVTLAHGRSQLPFSISNVAVTSGGTNTTSRSLYLAIQGENPAGLNLLSNIVGPVTINAGEQLQVTIPSVARASGEWWTAFVISASESNDPETFVQLARLPGYTVGGAATALPQTITFDSNDDLGLSAVVAATINLPPSPLHGALRGITELNGVFAYDQYSEATVDNLTVLLGSGGVGRWVRQGATFSTYIDDITQPGGCGQDITDLNKNNVAVPKYGADGGIGKSQRYWLINDSGVNVTRGTRVGIGVLLNEEPKSLLFHNLLRVTFHGFVETATGLSRTSYPDSSSFPLLNQVLNFQAKKSNLIVPDDLATGEAYVLEVYPNFSSSSLRNGVPKGTLIKLNPFFYEEAGEYSEVGAFAGDVIYPSGSLRLVVPDVALFAKALDGSGMVQSISFQDVGDTTVGLAATTSDQIIAINGNGAVRRVEAIDQTEAIRAYVGTVDGVGFASELSSNLNISANQVIQIVCNYPGAIRDNYPDTKIAGNDQGYFNPTAVVFYVKQVATGEIRSFPAQSVVSGASQTFTLPNWSTGTVINSIPAPTDPYFGLFAPSTPVPSITTGASDYAAGNYQAAVAFAYTNVVTSISHDETRGCIFTMTGGVTLSRTMARSQYWGEAANSIASLRAVSPGLITNLQTRHVAGIGKFIYNAQSTLTDDGQKIIRPSAIASNQPGRWLLEGLKPEEVTPIIGSALIVPDTATITALSSSDRAALPVRGINTNTPAWFFYNPASTDQGSDSVLVPDDNPATGRWIKMAGGGGGSTPEYSYILRCDSCCSVGGKAFEFSGAATLEITVVVDSNFTDIEPFSDAIVVYRYSKVPEYGSDGIETVSDGYGNYASIPRLVLPNTGGTGTISVDQYFPVIAFFARNNYDYDAVCAVGNGLTFTLYGF